MSGGRVTLTREGAIARVVFDRPEARNAMTWAMYAQLSDICSTLRGDASVRRAWARWARLLAARCVRAP